MPGRGKVVFPASGSGCSGSCPGLTARGWRPRAPKLCHRALLPGASLRPAARGLCSCPGKPEGSLAGAPCRSHRPRGKVRAGPFHADAGGLCQQPPLICRRRGCLPSGRPGGWGLGGPETQPWSWKGLGEAICCRSVRAARPGRGRRPGARGAAGTPPSAGGRCPRGSRAGAAGRLRPRPLERTGLPPWARLSAVTDGAGSRGPRRREGGDLSRPHSPPPRNPGGTASRWGRGCTREGLPAPTYPAAGVIYSEILFGFLFRVTNHAALWEL